MPLAPSIKNESPEHRAEAGHVGRAKTLRRYVHLRSAITDARSWGFPVTVFVSCGLIDLVFMHQAVIMFPLAIACVTGYGVNLLSDKTLPRSDSKNSGN